MAVKEDAHLVCSLSTSVNGDGECSEQKSDLGKWKRNFVSVFGENGREGMGKWESKNDFNLGHFLKSMCFFFFFFFF